MIEPSKKVDYLYYVGCAGSYDNNNQKVVQDTVKLLKRLAWTLLFLVKQKSATVIQLEVWR